MRFFITGKGRKLHQTSDCVSSYLTACVMHKHGICCRRYL